MHSAKSIKEKFKANMPNFLIVHWDSKVITNEKRKETDNHLAVVCTFPTEKPNNQFLGAPRIPDSTGESQKAALCGVMDSWEIPKERIIGMAL